MMNLSTINYANKKSLILILFFGSRNIIKIDNNHKYRIIIIIDYYGRKARRKIGNSRISRRKWKEMDPNVNGWSEDDDDDERIYSGQQKRKKTKKKTFIFRLHYGPIHQHRHQPTNQTRTERELIYFLPSRPCTEKKNSKRFFYYTYNMFIYVCSGKLFENSRFFNNFYDDDDDDGQWMIHSYSNINNNNNNNIMINNDLGQQRERKTNKQTDQNRMKIKV